MASPWSDVDVEGLLARTGQAVFLLNEKGSLAFANPSLHRLFDIPFGNRIGWRELEQTLLRPPADLPIGSLRRVSRPNGDDPGRDWYEIAFLRLGDDAAGAALGVWGFIRRLPDARPMEAAPAEGTIALEMLERRIDEQRRRWGAFVQPAASPAGRRIVEQMNLAASGAGPVAFVGEAGAGKLTMARWVHERRGSGRPAVVFDAQAIPAASQRQTFESLPRGQAGRPRTVIVRHVGSLAHDVQHQLAAMLDSEAEPLQLLATERSPLETAFAEGKLTSPLYFRITRLVVEASPLRQRVEDVPEFSAAILKEVAAKAGRGQSLEIEPAALALLQRHAWRGNLTELRAALERAAERASGGVLRAADFPRRLQTAEAADLTPVGGRNLAIPSLDAVLETVERRLLEVASRRFGGNKSKAADFLKVSRARFHRRWEQLNPSTRPPAGGEPEDDEFEELTRP